MLSKEEIEDINKLKDMFKYASKHTDATIKLDSKACKLLYEYVEQIETDKQKLIDRIENELQRM